jgi:hypothetical protein
LLQRPWLCVVASLWLLPACVGDLDYDKIEPVCEDPSFDVPDRDTFCAGRFEATAAASIAEGDRVVGMHNRGDDAVVLIAHDPQDSLGERASPTLINRYSLALAETDKLLGGDVGQLDGLPTYTEALADDETPLWTPRRLQVVANQGAVVHFLSDRVYTRAYAQQAVLAHLRGEQGARVDTFTVQSRTFFLGATAIDLTSIERGDRLELFYALGPVGLKPLRLEWLPQERRWRELLPPLREDAGLLSVLDRLIRNPDPTQPFIGELATLCRDLPEPHKADCEAQCEAECRLPRSPSCAACRLEYGLFRGFDEDEESPHYGAWAVEADEDAELVLVGQIGRVASFRNNDLQIRPENFTAVPAPVHTLALDAAAGEPPSPQHVITRLHREGDQLYLLAQDQRVVPLPFYPNVNADTLLPAFLAVVTWTNDGPDLDTLRAVQLPDEMKDTARVDFAPLRDDLLLLRTLETEEFTYEDTTVQRGEDPVWLLYDVGGEGAPRLLKVLEEDAGQEYDRYGLIYDAASGRVMAPEVSALQSYELESKGERLR